MSRERRVRRISRARAAARDRRSRKTHIVPPSKLKPIRTPADTPAMCAALLLLPLLLEALACAAEGLLDAAAVAAAAVEGVGVGVGVVVVKSESKPLHYSLLLSGSVVVVVAVVLEGKGRSMQKEGLRVATLVLAIQVDVALLPAAAAETIAAVHLPRRAHKLFSPLQPLSINITILYHHPQCACREYATILILLPYFLHICRCCCYCPPHRVGGGGGGGGGGGKRR